MNDDTLLNEILMRLRAVEKDNISIRRSLIEHYTKTHETVDPKPKRLEMWKPEEDDKVFWISSDGDVKEGRGRSNPAYLAGNVIRTSSEARAHAKRLGVFNRLWRLAEQCELVESDGFYIAGDKVWAHITSKMGGVHHTLYPHFKTKEDAQLVLDSLSEEDRRYLRGEN